MPVSRALWTRVGDSFARGSKTFLVLAIASYRTILVNFLGGACRFEPSCSEYALEAAKIHPPTTAIRLISRRVCSCRPGGRYGFDPVPPLAPKKRLPRNQQEKTA